MEQMTTSSNTCSVHLDGFDGPLDLLLNLVREQKFDITTVPLASVAEQYLAYVEAMDVLNVDVAAEYLVIAATLGFLKSRSLLPALPSEFEEVGEDSPEAIEERLRQRLMTYSRFRDVALGLKTRGDEATGFFLRAGGDAEADLQQRFRIDSERLSRALIKALTHAKPERRTIIRERYSLVLQMEYVARLVRTEGRGSFLTIVREYDRAGIICTFLAVLELVRQGRLAIAQDNEDDIELLPNEESEASVS
jgi:segregation and condensation protein A